MNTKASLVVMPLFLKYAAGLDKAMKSKLVRILWQLSEDFRHPSLQCKRVQGARESIYECRVDQSIRLIYDSSHGLLRCWFVGEHDEALRFAVNVRLPVDAIEVDDFEIEPGKETEASGPTGTPGERLMTLQQMEETLNS